jgi:hypothetical protein
VEIQPGYEDLTLMRRRKNRKKISLTSGLAMCSSKELTTTNMDQ